MYLPPTFTAVPSILGFVANLGTDESTRVLNQCPLDSLRIVFGEAEFSIDLAEAAESEHFWQGSGRFIKAAVDDKRINLIRMRSRLSVFLAIGHLPLKFTIAITKIVYTDIALLG